MTASAFNQSVAELVAKLAKMPRFVTLLLLPFLAACELYEPHEPVPDTAKDLLHSDLPIFGRGGDNEPQHFDNGDSFGCASRIRFGDWLFQETSAEIDGAGQWYRFSVNSIFHCWANLFRAYERVRLNDADSHPSFFAFLGNTNVNQREIELWTIQIGARPGSDYLLLSRAPSDEIIERFSVLQTSCPTRNVRDAGPIDILRTRYCAIGSRAELVRLARRMAKRAPLGTLIHVSDDDKHELE